jgi:hypothetical protein
MGMVLADFNNDGWTDIAVSNDSWPNFLFINKRNGRSKMYRKRRGWPQAITGAMRPGWGSMPRM